MPRVLMAYSSSTRALLVSFGTLLIAWRCSVHALPDWPTFENMHVKDLFRQEDNSLKEMNLMQINKDGYQEVDGKMTCADSNEKTQVLKFLPNKIPTWYKSDHPHEKELCLDLDWEGLEHGMGVEIGTPCYSNCYFDIQKGNGYCNLHSESKFRCGTGACCINQQSGYGRAGCKCDKTKPPYTDTVNVNRHECNDNGWLGTDDRSGCQPAVKNLRCECVDIGEGLFYSEDSIKTTCRSCPPGQYLKGCERNNKGECQPCEKGHQRRGFNNEPCKLCEPNLIAPDEGTTECAQCPHNTYANDDRTTCEPCTTCAENEVNIRCSSDQKPQHGQCVCDQGYYKNFDCQPVPLGFFKDKPGNDNHQDCKKVRGSYFTTENVASISIDACVCQQNYEYDAEEDRCKPCTGNTPYNEINGTGCRACHPYEYWTNNACQNLSRMELSFENEALYIKGQDKYRPFEVPVDPIIQQRKNRALPSDSYLDIPNHKPKSCPKCQAPFHERQACGTPHIKSQTEKQLWVRWTDDNQIERENLLTTPIADDGLQKFNSYSFWEQKNKLNDLRIKREGKCVRCHSCPSGKYQSKCIDGGESTCIDCTLDAQSCLIDQDKQFYLFHNLSTYRDNTWTGGCDLSPNIAQTDYECMPCEKWTRQGDDYYLLLGCGTTSQDTRWKEGGNTNDQLKLSDSTSTNEDKNDYASFKQRIPYCAPGWYVDTSDNQCFLSTDTSSTKPWNTECCKKCGDISSAQKKRGPNFTPCSGATNKDTEQYVDRCENGHYTEMVNGTQTCKACTTC